MSKKSKKRKHNDEITDVDRAVLSLKTQKRKLNSDRKRLEEVIEKNLAAVKELLAQKDKTKALLALKKKKMREDQLKNVDNWLLHVEELLNTIEFSQQQDSVIAALKVGSDALKDIQKEITMEDIDRLTEDTEEAKAYLEEVQQALGRDSAEDIAELEAELKAIEDEFVEKEKKDFPHVPETQPARVQPEAANKEADEVAKEVANEVANEVAEAREEPLLA